MRSCTLLALLLASVSARAEDDRHKKLDHGDVIVEARPLPGSDVPEVIVTAVVNSPPERVWPIVDRCNDYQRTMVHMKQTRELSREKQPDGSDLVRCESVIELTWPLPDLHGILQAKHTIAPGRWTREWHLESGDYKMNEGSWVLTQWSPGRTLIEYRQRSDPKISIPRWVQDLAARYAMPDLIEKIRNEAK